MITASPEFPIVFLPFLAIYWSLAKFVNPQKTILLVFGYLFYGLLNPLFALLLAAYTIYIFSAISLLKLKVFSNHHKTLAFAAIFGGAALLAYFKYFNFILLQFSIVVSRIGLSFTPSVQTIILPLGISFYIFQSVSYSIDVYKGKASSADLFNFSLYMCFFPVLLAGPICRPSELLNQIKSTSPRRLHNIEYILMLILSFLIKKVWLAAWLSTSIVDPVFSTPSIYSGIELVLAIVGYSLQIYFDFSGYTDLARAIAMLLGYEIPANFDLPYLARSLSEFWSKWHISLSTWIRDYIYIPLGGNRCSFFRFGLNIMIAMLLSGLWHGADLKYVAWGCYHGIALVLEKGLSRLTLFRSNIVLTFITVCIGWIFFRSPTLDSALDFIKGCLDWKVPLSPVLPHIQVVILVFACFWFWRNSPSLLRVIEEKAKGIPIILKITSFAGIGSLVLSLSPSGMPSFIYSNF